MKKKKKKKILNFGNYNRCVEGSKLGFKLKIYDCI